ncbi:MAG: outer membrane homotrimeric porin [Desulfovibrionaceae bacterium]
MKRIMTLVLAAGLVFGAATGASAIDFNAKGQWIFGFGAADSNFMKKDDKGRQNYGNDTFRAAQRVRLQMDAVASEALSGTVFFEIGDQKWGNAASGGALGADGTVVEVKRAYLDWTVPQTDLQFRMGLQGVTLPNAAGGSSILDDDVAGITASYKFNETVTLTALWARPYNDNYTAKDKDGKDLSHGNPANFLDNVDLFGLMLPVTMDGWKVTPWVMYGAAGKNALGGMEKLGKSAPYAYNGTLPFNFVNHGDNLRKNRAYSDMFFAGLPIVVTALDPFNFELDLNYGSAAGFGKYDTTNEKTGQNVRANSQRSGWLVKGLAEYKMEWMTPGLFAWYGSGDDGNVKNGSERMPAISPCGNFTSFMGDDPVNGWGTTGGSDYDLMLNYAGTWGIGAQLKDITFLEDLKHTFRIAYWGGTNDVSNVKYANNSQAAFQNVGGGDGFYLTTNDYLLEFNLDNTYKIYDNLKMDVNLGYIVNGVDRDTWKRSYQKSATPFSKGDGYKAEVFFTYSF